MSSFESVLSYVTITNVLSTLAIGLLLYRWFKSRNSNLPPGPWGVPILGNIPFINPFSEKTFANWAKKYGPVIYVQLGSHPTVILNDYDSIDEAFNKYGVHFNARYSTYFTDFACEGCGIMFLNGEETWKTQRRFGSRALSGIGLRGKSLEARVLDEVDCLCDIIRSKEGKPFVLEIDLMHSIANVINGITIKERCTEEGHEKFREYIEDVIAGFRRDGLAYSLLSVIPWCRYLPNIKKHLNMMREGLRNGNALFDNFIDQHREQLDLKDLRDFTDLFLAEHKQNTASFESLKQLRYYLKDLFAAGTETTTSTLRWLFFYLMKHPEVQQKIHEEIDRVIGREGKVKLDLDLPYTKAVIQENYRIKTVTPVGVPRCTSEDVWLNGYLIPKNTQIISNLWAVHNNPADWPEPEKFKPERHLDENGKFVKLNKVIPFSVGARSCLGENLARIEIFLVAVSILQKFEILPNPDNPLPDMDGSPGIVNSASHYPLIMKER